MQRITVSLVFGTGVLLGLGSPLARFAVADGIDVMAFTLWPTAVASLILVTIGLTVHGTLGIDRRLVWFGAVAGTFGHALPMLAAYWLATRAGAGFASLSFTLTPVLTLSIMALLGREALRPIRLAAVGLGMAGGLLLVGGQVWSRQLDASLIAVALLVPTLIAATNVYRGLHMPHGLSDAWLSAATLLGSSLLLAVFTPMFAKVGVLPNGTDGIHWLVLQTLALVAGYLCYFALQRRAEPVAFSLIGYVMMLVSVGIGMRAFGETVAWTLWPAIALIAAALWLIQRYPARLAP